MVSVFVVFACSCQILIFDLRSPSLSFDASCLKCKRSTFVMFIRDSRFALDRVIISQIYRDVDYFHAKAVLT